MSQTEFQQTIPFVVSTSSQSEQLFPDVDIKNPLDAKNFVNSIEIIPDPAFQMKGMIEIFINFLSVFKSPNVGFFKLYSKFSVPLSARSLDNQGHVTIFIWNGFGDGSPLSCSGTVKISDKNIDSSSGSIASTVPAGSDTLSLFSNVLRPIGSYTQQLDLGGYKKILLLIAAAIYQPPTVVSSDFSSDVNSVDGDLSTKTGQVAVGNSSAFATQIVDFGSLATRLPAFKANYENGNNNPPAPFVQAVITVSNDGVTWRSNSNFNDGIPQGSGQNVDVTHVGVSDTFRYYKVVFGSADFSPPQVSVYEMFDANIFGGTAALSFEALEPQTDQWIEVISPSQIGSISQGKQVAIPLGDTMAQTNLNALLASNYAGFRAKLTITIAAIQTAVSIQRLA